MASSVGWRGCCASRVNSRRCPPDEFARRSVPRWAASGTAVFAVESEKLLSDTPWPPQRSWAGFRDDRRVGTPRRSSLTRGSPSALVRRTRGRSPHPDRADTGSDHPSTRRSPGAKPSPRTLNQRQRRFRRQTRDPCRRGVVPVGSDLYSALVQLAETDIDFAAPDDGTSALHGGGANVADSTPGGYATTLSGERFRTASVRWETSLSSTGTRRRRRRSCTSAGVGEFHHRVGVGDALVQLQSSTLAAAEAGRRGDHRRGDLRRSGRRWSHPSSAQRATTCPSSTSGSVTASAALTRAGTLTTYRCVGVTVEAAGNAEARYVVELSSPLAERAANAARWLARSSLGSWWDLIGVGHGVGPGSGIPSGSCRRSAR